MSTPKNDHWKRHISLCRSTFIPDIFRLLHFPSPSVSVPVTGTAKQRNTKGEGKQSNRLPKEGETCARKGGHQNERPRNSTPITALSPVQTLTNLAASCIAKQKNHHTVSSNRQCEKKKKITELKKHTYSMPIVTKIKIILLL